MTAKKPQRKIRQPWERERLQVFCAGETQTDGSQHASTDINNIMKLYHRTGELAPNAKQGVFADVSNLQGDLTDRVEWAKQVHADMTAQIQAHAEKTKNDQKALKESLERGEVPTPSEEVPSEKEE